MFLPPPLHEIARALERDPCHFQPCLGQFIPAASKAPLTASTLGVGRSLGAPLLSLLLPCIQGLGSLSLPFPPPPLPTYDPTLRPHPSSLCQSGAAQPCRGAGAAGDPTLAGCRHACSQPGKSQLQEQLESTSSSSIHAMLQRLKGGRHPCHLNDVTRQAN